MTLGKGELAGTRAVCIGGGTGVPASIRALISLGVAPDAVVSVADDGGSSGLLRTHTGNVPPGDLRKCLVALAKDQHSPWTRALRKRFEYANNHALGNLVLTALQEATDSLAKSITLIEELLETRGHVYPASFDSVLLMGITRDGQRLVGQSTLCKSETALSKVLLEPAEPAANPDAVRAIKAADVVVLGPGSLFTSIIPNLLIPGIAAALRQSSATTVFVCPVADVQGETWGLSVAELTDALLAHGLDGRLDYALINEAEPQRGAGNVTGYFSAVVPDGEAPMAAPVQEGTRALRPVVADEHAVARIRSRGVKVLMRAMGTSQRPGWHDPALLAGALASVVVDARRH